MLDFVRLHVMPIGPVNVPEFGDIRQEQLEALAEGVTIDGMRYDTVSGALVIHIDSGHYDRAIYVERGTMDGERLPLGNSRPTAIMDESSGFAGAKVNSRLPRVRAARPASAATACAGS